MSILSNERLNSIIKRIDTQTEKEIGIPFSEIAETQPEILHKMAPSSITNGAKEGEVKDIGTFMNLIYSFQQEHLTSVDPYGNQDSIDNQNMVNYVSRHCVYYTENFMGFDSIHPEDGPTVDMINNMRRDNRIRFTLYQVNQLNGSKMSLVIPTSKTTKGSLDRNNWSHMAYAIQNDNGYSLLTVSFPHVEGDKSGINEYYNKNARPIFAHAEIKGDNIGQKEDGRFYVKDTSEAILPYTRAIDNDFAGPLMSIENIHDLTNKHEVNQEKVAEIIEDLNQKQKKYDEKHEREHNEVNKPSSFSTPSLGQ